MTIIRRFYTYTKLPVYKRLSGETEHLEPESPPVYRFDDDGEKRRVTWEQTGKVLECVGCLIIQWVGTFNHEREAVKQETEARRKEVKARREAIWDEFEQAVRT